MIRSKDISILTTQPRLDFLECSTDYSQGSKQTGGLPRLNQEDSALGEVEDATASTVKPRRWSIRYKTGHRLVLFHTAPVADEAPQQLMSLRKNGLCARFSIVRLFLLCGVSAGINASRISFPVLSTEPIVRVWSLLKVFLFADPTPNFFGDAGLSRLRSAVANAGTRWDPE